MAVIVAYGYAANPQDTSVGADGVVNWSRIKSAASEYDPVAIQLGRNLADAEGVELAGVAAGRSNVAGSMVRKNAMSKEFDRGAVVADDATAGWNAMKVTSVLAELVKSVEGADILLASDPLIDEGIKIVPALATGFLRWPAFQGVSAVVKTADGYEITRDVPGGSCMVAISGPVVVSASSDAIAPRVPSMKNTLTADKKPVEKVEVPSVDVEVTVVGRSKPERKARRSEVFKDADTPAQLVAALHADDVL